MIIKNTQIENMKNLGAEYIGSTTVWNVHEGAFSLNKNKNTYKKLTALYKSNAGLDKVIALVGKKGRSAHSATDIHIFSYLNTAWALECDMGSQSNKHGAWETYVRKEFV